MAFDVSLRDNGTGTFDVSLSGINALTETRSGTAAGTGALSSVAARVSTVAATAAGTGALSSVRAQTETLAATAAATGALVETLSHQTQTPVLESVSPSTFDVGTVITVAGNDGSPQAYVETISKTAAATGDLQSTLTAGNGTIISAGNISGTWYAAQSPYRIQGDVMVPKGSTLTIEAGVTVQFEGRYRFNMRGGVTAVGTAGSPIIFTTTAADIALGSSWVGWRGVRIDGDEYNLSQIDHGAGLYNFQHVVLSYVDKTGGATGHPWKDVSGCFMGHGFYNDDLILDYIECHHSRSGGVAILPGAFGFGGDAVYTNIYWHDLTPNDNREPNPASHVAHVYGGPKGGSVSGTQTITYRYGIVENCTVGTAISSVIRSWDSPVVVDQVDIRNCETPFFASVNAGASVTHYPPVNVYEKTATATAELGETYTQASGTAYTDTLNATAAATGALSSVAARTNTVAATAAATSALTSPIERISSVSDVATTVELLQGLKTNVSSVTDLATTVDSQVSPAERVSSVLDSALGVDSSVSTKTAVHSPADSAVLVDQPSVSAQSSVAVSASATGTGVLGEVVTRAYVETLSATATATSTQTSLAARLETLAGTSTATATPTSTAARIDTLSATASAVAILSHVRAVAETVNSTAVATPVSTSIAARFNTLAATAQAAAVLTSTPVTELPGVLNAGNADQFSGVSVGSGLSLVFNPGGSVTFRIKTSTQKTFNLSALAQAALPAQATVKVDGNLITTWAINGDGGNSYVETLASTAAGASTLSGAAARSNVFAATAAGNGALTNTAARSNTIAATAAAAGAVTDDVPGSQYALPAARSTVWNPPRNLSANASGWPTWGTTPLPANGGAGIQTQIDAAHSTYPNGVIVQLAAGTYDCPSEVQIPSNLVLRGAALDGGGNHTTTLTNSNGAQWGTNNHFGNVNRIVVLGCARWTGGYDTSYNLTSDANHGDYTIQVPSAAASAIAVGEYVILDQLSGAVWQTDPLGRGQIWASPDWSVVWQWHKRYEVGTVTATNGSTTVTGSGTNWTGANGVHNGDPIYIGGVLYRIADTNGVVSATQINLESAYTGTTGGGKAYHIGEPTDDPFPDAYTWFCRSNRPVNEIKRVVSKTATSLTFETPVHYVAYKTSLTAQVTKFNQPFVTNSGLERLKVSRGQEGSVVFEQAGKCWLKNVEVTQSLEYGAVYFNSAYGCEVRDSYIHTAAYPINGGAGYNIAISWGSSECLVENNISVRANKVIVAQCAGAGCVVAYNYFDMATIDTAEFFNWMEVHANASHMVGPHHVLFEGNYSPNFDSDKTHGSSSNITTFRNHFSAVRHAWTTVNGHNPDPYGGVRRCIGTQGNTYIMNHVGNVLGISGGMSGFVYDYASDGGINQTSVWLLGWDDWSPNPYDSQVAATTLRDGNFDYLTNELRWHGIGGAPTTTPPAANTMPDSFYLGSKPSFFGANQWPWVNAAGATKLYSLPARVRFDANTPNVVP